MSVAMRRMFRLDNDNPLTGWHALALVCAFFGVIIAVNLVMALYATGTFPGLVVDNSYVASQRYNLTLAEARAQEASGIELAVSNDRGIVRVEVTDRAGVALHDLVMTALAGRPLTAREDGRLEFVETGESYVARRPLAAGRWEIDVEARHGADVVYRARREIFVEPEAEP